jgi:tetratricopeptide (TPR) repeat protein
MSNIIEIKPSSLAKNKVSISIILLAVMAVVTFHRSTVWKDNLALLEDSVSKNPEFYYIRGEYAKELASRGDINNARIQFTIANDYNRTKKRLRYGNSLFQLRYWELPELGLAYLLAKENKIPQAIDAYERIIQASNGESVVALRNVLYLYGDVMRETKPGPASLKIKEKLSGYSCKLYEVSGEADVYYTLGKIFLAQGEREEAINYFQKAEDKFSADNKYKIISQKFIARLENE